MSELKASANPATEPRRVWLWIRVSVTIFVAAALILLGVVALIFFNQHSMIYHPRPYDGSYAHALPSRGVQIDYALPFGKQTAYYVPTGDQRPKRIWLAFCGNGSLALDWTTILRGYPPNGDGFLMVDYPGYGKNSGYATIQSTRATAEAALDTLLNRLGLTDREVQLCAIGHSLGAAVALDFAAHRTTERILLISPFTSLRDEAARIVGRRLSVLLVENYDNRHNIGAVFQRNPHVRLAIFHGSEDDIIPMRMGGELKQAFPVVDFFPIKGADHVTVLDQARDQIIAWMSR